MFEYYLPNKNERATIALKFQLPGTKHNLRRVLLLRTEAKNAVQRSVSKGLQETAREHGTTAHRYRIFYDLTFF